MWRDGRSVCVCNGGLLAFGGQETPSIAISSSCFLAFLVTSTSHALTVVSHWRDRPSTLTALTSFASNTMPSTSPRNVLDALSQSRTRLGQGLRIFVSPCCGTMKVCRALSRPYHKECLSCGKCGVSVADKVFSSPEGQLLCERDYGALFKQDVCETCQRVITGSYMQVSHFGLSHPTRGRCWGFWICLGSVSR